MKIVKRRVNGTSIVLVGEKLYTRTEVTDELWIAILEQIDKVQEAMDSPEKIEEELDYLLYLVDPEKVAKQKRMEEMVVIAIQVGDLEPDKEKRIKKAKRVTDISGIFEMDDNGIVYMKGFEHSMPKIMIDAVLDAYYNPKSEYTVSSLLNFWKYLLLNPDKHVREGLFQWIKTGKFAITEDGNIIAYRNVDVKQEGSNKKLQDFISESWAKVKRWKKSCKNYWVIDTNGSYSIVIVGQSYDGKIIGNLDELFNKPYSTYETTIYTAQHKGQYGQTIILGQPVSMPRSECDNSPSSSCSVGLHCKSISYGMGFGSNSLVTVINPYNVVAIPNGEFSKFRCCEYLPVSKAEVVNGQIVEFEAGTYDIPYNGLESLETMLNSMSVENAIREGLLNEDIDFVDLKSVLNTAKEIISNRVVKMN
jgi:hypothetical protein